MFNIDGFIIAVYWCVDAHLESLLTLYPPRSRGFAPGLSDSEVLTLEIVGDFLGHHDDSAIWWYFRRCWQAWFPGLGHRSTFIRQAANLWQYKQLVHQRLIRALAADLGLILSGSPAVTCGI